MKVVIVGMGIAGLSAAYAAYEAGDEVIVITKSNPLDFSASAWAQGGIAYHGRGDSAKLFKRDILGASGGMARVAAVDLLVKHAPKLVEEILIKKMEVPFSKTGAGGAENEGSGDSYAFVGEAAHSVKRILFYDDITGKVILKSMLRYLKRETSIRFLLHHLALDLINLPHHSRDRLAIYEQPRCIGLYILNLRTQKTESFFSDKIILATGGIGSLYQHTTNPSGATGDGIALARRAGARVVNMEFTQFHPTTLAIKEANNFLISEALRGEGAILRNERGEDFIKKRHPLGSLAPRDVVARAIVGEQAESGGGAVYLSVKHLDSIDWRKRFPKITRVCNDFRIKFPAEDIPVTPAFHFSCGGILTDLAGKTSIDNLFAVGECACTGVHGANRLASTSLLEGLYFGNLAGKSRYAVVPDRLKRYNLVKEWEAPIAGGIEADAFFLKQSFTQLRSIMWNYVGVIRKKNHLFLALSQLQTLQEQVEGYYRSGSLKRELIELRNAIQTALLVSTAAIKNPISCGCHFIEE